VSDGTSRPRVLFVGRSRLRLPLPDWVAGKWDAIEREVDYRVLGASADGVVGAERGRFRLEPPRRPRILDGAFFHLRLPFVVRQEIRRFRPDAIVAADPFVGAGALAGRALSRRRPSVIVEVHGDWRTFSRLYGSEARRVLAPFADRLAAAALRRADATRALSSFTSGLVEEIRGRPADASFPTFSDLSAFTASPPAPLPEHPTALFVGMLEAYKNVDGLAAAWRRVAPQLPDARLVVVGRGARRSVVEALVRELPGRVTYHEWLEPSAVAAALDESTLLVLPSWPEGLGRVVIEAFARGRGVVATGAGGILDLVDDGVQGLLVPPADTDALVDALLRVLQDRELAERLGGAARVRYGDWEQTPEDFARATRALVDTTLARAPS
jgi:glycosyltransferase involved in cell wall biosynthesis